jgi:hypothetical protein
VTDAVNSPRHYNAHPSGVEAIVLCEWLGFCAGNALKYAWRAGQKGQLREDLSKSLWYVRRMREGGPCPTLGLPTALIETARRVVNAEPCGSLLAVMIHQIALPAVIRDEHLENAEYALVRAIEEIVVHQASIARLGETVGRHAECGAEKFDELSDDADKVTCEECRRLA